MLCQSMLRQLTTPSGNQPENDKVLQSFVYPRIYIILIRIVLYSRKLYIPGLSWMETAKSTIMAEAGKYCEHMTKLYKAGLLQTKVANSTRALGSLSLDTHFIN